MQVAVLLFENFETLDVFGPVGIFGRITDLYNVRFFSLTGGPVKNHHGVSVLTEKLETIGSDFGIFLIPGGIGTRKEVGNDPLIGKIREISDRSRYVLTICTGSALLAKTGLLDGKMATSNKRAFDWVMTNGPDVKWIREARWCADGKYYTSAGVSAGIDMSLGFLADIYGIEFARRTAMEIEYKWNEDETTT
jgi:putative intracellular protease/amidase